MSDYDEPWTECGTGVYLSHGAVKSAATPVCHVSGETADQVIARRDRIIACVNFLAGVPTADLEVLMRAKIRSDDHYRQRVLSVMRDRAQDARDYEGRVRSP